MSKGPCKPSQWARGGVRGRGQSLITVNSCRCKANSSYSLAFGEASLILARLIWAFDLELFLQCSNWADQRAYIIWDKGPLLVKLTPRS